MSQRIVQTLHELGRRAGYIAVRCPTCGHSGAFGVGDMRRHRDSMGLSSKWSEVIRSFRCSACSTKPVKVHFVAGVSPPLVHQKPPSAYVPAGVDVREFLRSDLVQRKRLVRRARG
jgi:hypothetical protein